MIVQGGGGFEEEKTMTLVLSKLINLPYRGAKGVSGIKEVLQPRSALCQQQKIVSIPQARDPSCMSNGDPELRASSLKVAIQPICIDTKKERTEWAALLDAC